MSDDDRKLLTELASAVRSLSAAVADLRSGVASGCASFTRIEYRCCCHRHRSGAWCGGGGGSSSATSGSGGGGGSSGNGGSGAAG